MSTIANLIARKERLMEQLRSDPGRTSARKSRQCSRRSIPPWPCSSPEAPAAPTTNDALRCGKTALTIAIARAKNSRRGLETFSSLLNFFGVAIAATGTPFGVPRHESGAGRCPEPARTHLAPRRIWI